MCPSIETLGCVLGIKTLEHPILDIIYPSLCTAHLQKFYEARSPNPIDHMDIIGTQYAEQSPNQDNEHKYSLNSKAG